MLLFFILIFEQFNIIFREELMDKLHSHNYLIVLVGTIALSVMTFFQKGLISVHLSELA